MTFLYVLTSTPTDNYYEQFLLSLTSLKLNMPDVHTTLLCDSKTRKNLVNKRTEYEKLISNIITVNAPVSFSNIEVSRWIKTSMRRFIQGDFLFIDCDTVITNDLSSVFELGIEFGACLDKHSLIDTHNNKKLIINNDKKLNFNSYKNNRYYNSGIIFCKDTPKTNIIFDHWHELWLYSKNKKILRDQPAFNMAIYENQSYFTELDGTWNCQIAYNGLPYLSNAKIIHYFATDNIYIESPFLLSDENIINQIKSTGLINNDISEFIKKPLSAFKTKTQIISGNDMLYIINSNFFQFIYILRKKVPLLFNLFNSIFSFFKFIIKGILIILNKNRTLKIYN